MTKITVLLAASACLAAAQVPLRELVLPAHRPQSYGPFSETFLAELPDDAVAFANTVDGAIRVTRVEGSGARIADTLLLASRDYNLECLGLYRAPDHLVLAVWKTRRNGAIPVDSIGGYLLSLSYHLAPHRQPLSVPFAMTGAMDDSGNLYTTGISGGIFVRKIAPDGKLIYQKEYDSLHYIEGKRYVHFPTRVRILSDGNVYVVGYFTPTGHPNRLHGFAGYLFRMSPGGDSLGFAQYPDGLSENDITFRDVADDGSSLLICGAEDRTKRIFLGRMPLGGQASIAARFISVPGSGYIRGDEIAYNQAKRRWYLHGVHANSYLYTFDENLDSLRLLNFDLPTFDDSRGGFGDMVLSGNGVLYLSEIREEPSSRVTGLPILLTLMDDAPARLAGRAAPRRIMLGNAGARSAGYSASGRWLTSPRGPSFGQP